MRQAVLIAFFWVLTSPALAVGVDAQVLEDPAKEAAAQAIMQELRCLVCQNQSIVDSNAPLAADLRQIVRERVALGGDGDAVKAYLVERYGDWVLLNPPIKGSTYLLWATPFVTIFFGAIIVFAMRNRASRDLSDDDARKADQLMRDGLK